MIKWNKNLLLIISIIYGLNLFLINLSIDEIKYIYKGKLSLKQ